MREDGGRVVLMDFGAGHEHQNGAARAGRNITGTPLYMAPELFSGGQADQRTDIYALGVLLFHLATGRFPVTGGSIRELGDVHAHGDRTRLRDLRADLPVPLVRAVEKATAPNPTDRFRTIGDFEAALERAVIGDRRPTRQWPQPTWKVIAAVAIAGAVLGGALWTLRPSVGAPPRNRLTAALATTELTTRRLSSPAAVFLFTNPSDDGRYVAGMLNENGDAAIVDLVTGDYRALRLGRGDGSDGYASLGALSRDGRFVAIDWYKEQDASLRVVATDGTGARVLVDPPGDVRAYEWSRDGAMILVALGRENGSVLALVAARDGGVRVLRELGSAIPRHASLSPDARYVAYDYPQSPGASDHDLFVVDTHTLDRWTLDVSPAHEIEPLWAQDGRAVVFLSDRNRNPSLWSVAVENGRPTAASRLVKDDVGRVVLRGITPNGTLFYQLNAGFAEVYLAPLEGSAVKPQPISPRQALSNFYPVWSREGRYVAYTSERSISGRELWVFDVESGRESQVPVSMPLGRAYGWSHDSQSILVSGSNDGRLYTIDRATGRVEAVASGIERAAAWGPAGIVYQKGRRVVVYDAQQTRTLRTIHYSDPGIVDVGRPPVLDGRSVIFQHKDGRVTLNDTATGQSWTWHDYGVEGLREHIMAPHTRVVAYAANRRDLRGGASTLMLWGGSGEPREVLRVHDPENFRLVGWTPDGLNLLVNRWSFDSAAGRRVGNEALWRVPITGGAPVLTGIALEGLRDVSMHPNGRQITFNAGWKRVEHWVMENALPK
jgi:Tol biopolymer transport system component